MKSAVAITPRMLTSASATWLSSSAAKAAGAAANAGNAAETDARTFLGEAFATTPWRSAARGATTACGDEDEDEEEDGRRIGGEFRTGSKFGFDDASRSTGSRKHIGAGPRARGSRRESARARRAARRKRATDRGDAIGSRRARDRRATRARRVDARRSPPPLAVPEEEEDLSSTRRRVGTAARRRRATALDAARSRRRVLDGVRDASRDAATRERAMRRRARVFPASPRGRDPRRATTTSAGRENRRGRRGV